MFLVFSNVETCSCHLVVCATIIQLTCYICGDIRAKNEPSDATLMLIHNISLLFHTSEALAGEIYIAWVILDACAVNH
jgi:hypothetical protein